MSLDQLKKELSELKDLQDDYLKYARNDEALNEKIRALQAKINLLK
ncbi:MAG: hypothetical protein K2P85_04960 [Flavobacteriaceae bacterium]|nr:hypothetical protein [Flavobacteriaceae bacterium]